MPVKSFIEEVPGAPPWESISSTGPFKFFKNYSNFALMYSNCFITMALLHSNFSSAAFLLFVILLLSYFGTTALLIWH
jgi:hypothetical protein